MARITPAAELPTVWTVPDDLWHGFIVPILKEHDPEPRTGRIDGYHCWAEFYANGKWWPIDISEGDKYSALATYFFGRHPANRVELSRGRDIVIEPGPESGPINFHAYPVLEVAGKPVQVNTAFGYQRLSGEEASP